jgi:hypothetical protein
MKLVNRGFIFIRPKQAFCDWAKQHDSEFDFNESDDLEGNVYLIEDDFFEIEPLLEQHFKKIFMNECQGVVEDDEFIPKLTMELFLDWFEIQIGSTVFDTQKSQLTQEEL